MVGNYLRLCSSAVEAAWWMSEIQAAAGAEWTDGGKMVELAAIASREPLRVVSVAAPQRFRH